jgi:hypothetical protein
MSSQFQSQLSNLVQMATLEQLNLMMEQMKRMNCPESVINANKNENLNKNENIKIKLEPQPANCTNTQNDEFKCDRCANYDSLFHRILSKLDKQTQIIERLETKLAEVSETVFRLDVWGQPCFVTPESGVPVPDPIIFDEIKKEEVTYTHYESLIKEEPKEEVGDEVVILEPIKVNVEVIEVDSSEEEKEKEVPNVTLDIKEIEESSEEEEDSVVEEQVSEEKDESVEEEQVSEEKDESVEEEHVSVEEEQVSEEEEQVSEEEEQVSEEEEPDSIVEEEQVSEEEEVVSEEEQVSEEEVVSEEEEKEKEKEIVKEESVEEDEEDEVFEIEIDDVTYFATDEENGILYEMDKNGDVGKKVGIIKDGEPIFS